MDGAGVVMIDTDETGHFTLAADPPGELKESPGEP